MLLRENGSGAVISLPESRALVDPKRGPGPIRGPDNLVRSIPNVPRAPSSTIPCYPRFSPTGLPRQLPYPPCVVTTELIAKSNPALRDVPIPFIRQQIEDARDE